MRSRRPIRKKQTRATHNSAGGNVPVLTFRRGDRDGLQPAARERQAVNTGTRLSAYDSDGAV